MRLFSDEISPEEAREYGLDDHALTNSIDLKRPILQTMYMENMRQGDLEAGAVREKFGLFHKLGPARR